jgi:hypothetical protein
MDKKEINEFLEKSGRSAEGKVYCSICGHEYCNHKPGDEVKKKYKVTAHYCATFVVEVEASDAIFAGDRARTTVENWAANVKMDGGPILDLRLSDHPNVENGIGDGIKRGAVRAERS